MTGCGSDDQLKRLLADQLDRAETAALALHIEGCLACRALLDRMTSTRRTSRVAAASGALAPLVLQTLRRLKSMGPLHESGGLAAEPSFAAQDCVRGVEAPHAGPIPPAGALQSLNQALPLLGGFRIVREVGRGGMGVVYEAEEERLSRRVALKVLPASLLKQPKQVERFAREAKAAARLHHSNIVPVFGVGEENGHHYYFMQYIEGMSVAAILDEKSRTDELTPGPKLHVGPSRATCPDVREYRQVARLGVQVAEALEYAHAQGVLHRDIKPSNLLVDDRGNVWVADFGVAKTQGIAELTSAGELLGTIRYMAPERFAGECDPRSDVYSLGITLYEIAGQRPAYEASDRYDLIGQIRRSEPVSLRKLAPAVPRDLETIVQKAIDRDPARRYQTAGALADDLRRFMEGRPIQARLPSSPERVFRWCNRNRWASAFLLALGLGAIASGWQAIRATSAEREARRAETVAHSDRDRAQRARDRALRAVRELLLLENGLEAGLQGEEMQSSRKALLTAGVQLSSELVQELAPDPNAQFELIEAYHGLSRIQKESGDLKAAIESARQAVALAERLHEGANTLWSARHLAYALQLQTLVLSDHDAREQAARRSTGLLEAFLPAASQDVNAEFRRMIAANHHVLGHKDVETGRFAEAVGHFLTARPLYQKLHDQFPSDRLVFAELASTHRYICRARRLLGQSAESVGAGREALSLYSRLHADYPDEFEYAHALQLTFQELGLAYLNGATSEAIDMFEAARKTLRSMAAKFQYPVSRHLFVQSHIAMADRNIRVAADSDPVRYAAVRRAAVLEAYEICDKLAFAEPLSVELRQIYADACLNVSLYREWERGEPEVLLLRKAEKLWVEVLRLEPGSLETRGFLVIVRRKLAEALAVRGDPEEAKSWRALSLTTARGDGSLFVEIALEYARQLGPIDHLATTLDVTARAALRQSVVNDALAMLREAVHDGFNDANRLRGEAAFAPISSTAEFRAILFGLKLPRDVFAPPIARR